MANTNALRVARSITHPMTMELLAKEGEQVTSDLLYRLSIEGADCLNVETTSQDGTAIVGVILFDTVK